MKRTTHQRFAILAVALQIGMLLCPLLAGGATFTVTSTNDSGAGTLRNAILLANSTPGADLIDFNIPRAGLHTISPNSGLPPITDPVTMDGYTQPGSSRNTLLNGGNAVLQIELNGGRSDSSLSKSSLRRG